MDWQQIISLVLVTLSFVLIVRSEVRKHALRKSRPCGGDCNCGIKNKVVIRPGK